MNSPFQFASLATDSNFVDHVQDLATLKQLLTSDINVMPVSPRHWRKSGLAGRTVQELQSENGNVHVCLSGGFSFASKAEIYRTFASGIITCASFGTERWTDDAERPRA